MSFRRLAFIEAGDPGGFPVIYCHGFPSSGREVCLLEEAARTAAARVIAPHRPGYGKSDFVPRRRLADWTRDLVALVDDLALERFALIGVSGGAPYALAGAWAVPGRIRGCALVCPLGPVYLDAVLRQMNRVARLNFGLARRVPVLYDLLLGSVSAGLLAARPAPLVRLRRFNLTAADRAALADARIRRILDQSIEDALRDGARGARQDLVLYLRDWGFPLEAVDLPIDLWHGEADVIVPVSHAQWYASHLRRVRVHLLPGEGHYSLPLRHADAIVRALLAHSGADAG